MSLRFISASISPNPASTLEPFIIAAGVEEYGILWDASNHIMYDSASRLISPPVDYKSAYTGDVISTFVGALKN